jgi:hypothetical protein
MPGAARVGILSGPFWDEIAAVIGKRCGHECAAHSQGRKAGETPYALICQRAAGHEGAILAIDQHVGQDECGALVTWTCVCESKEKAP